MRLHSTFLWFALLFVGSMHAQHISNPFSPVSGGHWSAAQKPLANPSVYTTFHADFATLDAALAAASGEANTITLELPVPGGTVATFSVWRTEVMHPDLAARFPGIRTYAGESVDGTGRGIRITTSVHGFQAMYLRSDMGLEFLEPFQKATTDTYVLYDGKDVLEEDAPAVFSACGLQEEMAHPSLSTKPSSARNRNADEPVALRTYRFAVATTGHFALDNGGTLDAVLAAVVDRAGKMSAILERDADIRLQLVSNNNKLIFLDPDTDPYSGDEVGSWMTQNTSVLNSLIGNNNYDLGHVFGRYFTGFAIGVASGANACANNKGAGASAGTGSYGPSFIETAVHEVGHQLSAGHTWNQCSVDAAAQRAGSSAFEPGSGTTLMSYSGSCGSNNVGAGEAYYHAGTIAQIRQYTTQSTGSTCGTVDTLSNIKPVVVALDRDSVTIPISTPFELRGEGFDVDGDMLTFAWEQMDVGEEVPLGTEGFNSPLFRVFTPGSSTNRVFPRLSNLVNNASSISELLPTMTRPMNFRLIARDNKTGGGGVAWDNIRFFVTNQAGPFRVLNPNTSSVSWTQGAWEKVEWDVANTDAAPVNCRTVDILLSTDNGFTYPVTLATGLPNNGSAYVFVPQSLTTSFARVRVNGGENIFFDISNFGFKILPPQAPSVSVGLGTTGAALCLPEQLSVDIYTAALGGFSGPVELEIASGLPTGAQAQFSASTIMAGEQTTLNLDLNNVTENGEFVVLVRAKPAGANEVLLPITLNLSYSDFSLLAPTGPADGSAGLVQTPVLNWAPVPNIDYYEVQVATSPAFNGGDIVFSKSGITTNSVQVETILPKGDVFYWRVRAFKTPCNSDWTPVRVFASVLDQCATYEASDLPINITANSPVKVESRIFVPLNATISDVNVKGVQGFHDFFGQLEMRLKGPLGSEIQLLGYKCGSYSGVFNFGFDNASVSAFACPPGNSGFTYKPSGTLDVFNGQNSSGEWTLKVSDVLMNGGGSISGFQLEICSSTSLNGPQLINNNPLSLPIGNNAAISTNLLKTEDADNGPGELVYTLMTKPAFGRLGFNWGPELLPGAQFTQSDLDNGAIRYFDYGISPLDEFRFSVTDNAGGLIASTFLIQPMVSSTSEQSARLADLDFELAPNPSTGRVQMRFAHALTEDARVNVYSLEGRLVKTVNAGTATSALWLELDQLPAGLYAVRVETTRQAGVRKLVLRR